MPPFPLKRFIERVLVAGLGVGHVVIGYDFYFGNKRGGNPELMVRAGEELGFGVTVMPPVAEDGETFSSSTVRLHLAQGDVKGAAHMLGEPWRVSGQSRRRGEARNGLRLSDRQRSAAQGHALGHGIYAVRAYFDGTVHDAAAYLGTRPTFDDGMPVLEVFLFDFNGDLYGREIEVEFIDFIRGDRRFRSVDELVVQMDEDIAKARAILAKAEVSFAALREAGLYFPELFRSRFSALAARFAAFFILRCLAWICRRLESVICIAMFSVARAGSSTNNRIAKSKKGGRSSIGSKR